MSGSLLPKSFDYPIPSRETWLGPTKVIKPTSCPKQSEKNSPFNLRFNTRRTIGGASPVDGVQAILNAISELRRSGMSILLVEQNVVASVEISDHSYVMETGKIFVHGKCSELLHDESIRKSYLGI